MRTILVAFSVMFLALICCSPNITHIPRDVELLLCDFTKYQKQGFTFTPYQPNGQYESMGFIDCTVWPELNYKVPDSYVKKKSKIKTDTRNYKRWMEKPVRTEEVLDIVYAQAIEMGANTICEVRIVEVDTLILKYPKDGYKTGIRLMGWAIKQ